MLIPTPISIQYLRHLCFPTELFLRAFFHCPWLFKYLLYRVVSLELLLFFYSNQQSIAIEHSTLSQLPKSSYAMLSQLPNSPTWWSPCPPVGWTTGPQEWNNMGRFESDPFELGPSRSRGYPQSNVVISEGPKRWIRWGEIDSWSLFFLNSVFKLMRFLCIPFLWHRLTHVLLFFLRH